MLVSAPRALTDTYNISPVEINPYLLSPYCCVTSASPSTVLPLPRHYNNAVTSPLPTRGEDQGEAVLRTVPTYVARELPACPALLSGAILRPSALSAPPRGAACPQRSASTFLQDYIYLIVCFVYFCTKKRL